MSDAQPGGTGATAVAPMRRLLALITALLFLEMIFLAVLAPLLPDLRQELRLSTTQAGVLSAMYALGALCGAVAAVAVAQRRGPKVTGVVSLAMFAAASLAFGLVDSYPALLATRLAQGISGAVCWTAGMVWLLEVAPVRRRGELLGIAFGFAEAGAIAGPVIGGLAVGLGRTAVFGAIAALCLLLAAITTRFPSPLAVAGEGEGLRLGAMLRSPRVRATIWLTTLPALMLAAVSVLAPLQQDALGAGAGEIAATFGVAALAGVLIRPLWGRWSDRQGPLRPVRTAMLVNVPVMVALPWLGSRLAVAVFVCAALVLIGVLWAPLMVMLSDACLAVGVGQIMAVAVMNLTWPPGNVLGAAGGAAIAQATSQRFAYAVMGTALLAGALALGRRRSPLAADLYVAGAR